MTRNERKGFMIKGIGIDTVNINEIARYMKEPGDAFITRTFSDSEVRASSLSPKPEEYLAARFAAKEAVFKAIAHFTKEKAFDFRIVETLNESDGYPYIHVNEKLKPLLAEAGIGSLLISITTEDEYATAMVVAVTDVNDPV